MNNRQPRLLDGTDKIPSKTLASKAHKGIFGNQNIERYSSIGFLRSARVSHITPS